MKDTHGHGTFGTLELILQRWGRGGHFLIRQMCGANLFKINHYLQKIVTFMPEKIFQRP